MQISCSQGGAEISAADNNLDRYEVHAITQEDKYEKLLTGLDDSEQALYLEQGKDQPVRRGSGR